MFAIQNPYRALGDLLSNGPLSSDCRAHWELADRLMGHRRHYHGLYHVAQLWHLHRCMVFQNQQLDYGASAKIAACILYHDAIYDATQRDNEAKSADLWINDWTASSPDYGKFDWTLAEVDWIADTIRATSDHLVERPMETDDDMLREWFLGLDLAALAAPPEIFDRNNALIRIEYSHVSDEDWKAGNGNFLRSLLAAPAIFKHSILRGEFEEAARRNIERRLATL